MKKKNGFTLVELLAVIVILAVIILIAINAVLPQMAKARKNSFADEVMNYAKAAETKYVSDVADDNETGNISSGICYNLKDLHGEYVSKNDKNYTGVVVIKQNTTNTNLFNKFVYLASTKLYYNTTTASGETATLSDDNAIGKVTGKKVNDGNSNDLIFKTCCDYKKSLNSDYECTNADKGL